MSKNEIPIDYNKLKDSLNEMITPDMRAFVESQIGRKELSLMSEEAWMDFLLGAALWGISVGVKKGGLSEDIKESGV